MNNKKINIDGGYFVYNLALLFIALKLTGYITWSWWYVLMPVYPAIIIGALALLMGCMAIVVKITNK